jgi:Holliday junction resolvase
MRESSVQSKIKTALEKSGWFVTKLIQTTTNGIPDLMAMKEGRAVFIEVKRPGGKVSDLQKYTIEKLQKAGFEAFAAWSVEDVRHIL